MPSLYHYIRWIASRPESCTSFSITYGLPLLFADVKCTRAAQAFCFKLPLLLDKSIVKTPAVVIRVQAHKISFENHTLWHLFSHLPSSLFIFYVTFISGTTSLSHQTPSLNIAFYHNFKFFRGGDWHLPTLADFQKKSFCLLLVLFWPLLNHCWTKKQFYLGIQLPWASPGWLDKSIWRKLAQHGLNGLRAPITLSNTSSVNRTQM